MKHGKKIHEVFLNSNESGNILQLAVAERENHIALDALMFNFEDFFVYIDNEAELATSTQTNGMVKRQPIAATPVQ